MAHDPYLQAAEGFLHAVRDEIDMLDVSVEQTLKLTTMYALVSIARSLNTIVTSASTESRLTPPAG